MPFISLIKLNGKTFSTEEAGHQRRWSQKLSRIEQEKKAGPQLKQFRICIILKAVFSEEGLVTKQYGRHQQSRHLKWKRLNKPKHNCLQREYSFLPQSCDRILNCETPPGRLCLRWLLGETVLSHKQHASLTSTPQSWTCFQLSFLLQRLSMDSLCLLSAYSCKIILLN